jgi:hypothetical protein
MQSSLSEDLFSLLSLPLAGRLSCALQHKRTCRRLLKHLPMIDNGEVEVDSLLVHNTKIIYKCSAVSGMPQQHSLLAVGAQH